MKKNGFTLIELLAVIVILAIIAVIATPIIVGIIEDSRKSALKSSAQGMIKSAEFYYANQTLNQENNTKTFFTSDDDYEGLDYSGEKIPGKITSTDGRNISIALYKNGYCAYKNEADVEIIVSESDSLENCLKKLVEMTCKLKEEDNDILYNCNVGSNINKDFYLLEEGTDTVTFLATENLENSETSTYVEGNGDETLQWVPTLHNKLLELTSSWTNVTVSLPTKSQVEMIDISLISGSSFWTRAQLGVSGNIIQTNSTIGSGNVEFIPNVKNDNYEVKELAVVESCSKVYVFNGTSLVTKCYEMQNSDSFPIRPVITVLKELVELKNIQEL